MQVITVRYNCSNAWIPCILFWQHWWGTPESSTTLYHLDTEPNPRTLWIQCIFCCCGITAAQKTTLQNSGATASADVCADLWKAKRRLRGFYTHTSAPCIAPTLKHASGDSVCYFHEAGALRAGPACIWFHRGVVNMPALSASPLFWHAQLRRSSSKVSARGCGHCRSTFTHTNLRLSDFSPAIWVDVTASVPLPGPGLYAVALWESNSMPWEKWSGLGLQDTIWM